MKYYYHENSQYEDAAKWKVFKTKDEFIDYLVYQKLGDEWRKEE